MEGNKLPKFETWFKKRNLKSNNELKRAKFNAMRRTNRRLLEHVEKIEDKQTERQFAAQMAAQTQSTTIPDAVIPPTTVSTLPVVSDEGTGDEITTPITSNPADTVSVTPVGTPSGETPPADQTNMQGA